MKITVRQAVRRINHAAESDYCHCVYLSSRGILIQRASGHKGQLRVSSTGRGGKWITLTPRDTIYLMRGARAAHSFTWVAPNEVHHA